MKKLIRHGVFETNSSSCHSISIARGAQLYDTLEPDMNGIIVITPGEYGWEERQLFDPEEKASYALTFANTGAGQDEIDRMTNMLIEVIKKHTGCKQVVFDTITTWGDDGYGYIDHQSAAYENGDCLEAFQSKENLKELLFNPSSYIETDNDNH